MYEMVWSILALVILIIPFAGLIGWYFGRPGLFLQGCLGIGFIWISYGLMIYFLHGGSGALAAATGG